jgi:hypothetical protein
VEVRTEHQTILSRDIDLEPTCCGTTSKQKHQIIEVITKILVNGVNIAKNLPEFVSFLNGLGISI